MLKITSTEKQIGLQIDERRIDYYRKIDLRFRMSNAGDMFYVYTIGAVNPFIEIHMSDGVSVNGVGLTSENMGDLLESIAPSPCSPVSSVNGQTGNVVLNLDDVAMAGASTLLSLAIGEATADGEAATLGQAKAQAAEAKEYTDTKLNQTAVHNIEVGDSYQDSGQLGLKVFHRYLGTGTVYSSLQSIREASATQNGLQSKESFQQIQANTARISELQGKGGALPHNDFGQFDNPLTDAQKQALTVYAIDCIWLGNTGLDYDTSDPAASTFNDASGNPHTAAEIFNSTWVRNDFDNHRFVLTNTQDTDPKIFDWADVGIDTVSIATEATAGVVLSTEDEAGNEGYVNVTTAGTQKVIGWDALRDTVVNIQEEIGDIASALDAINGEQ